MHTLAEAKRLTLAGRFTDAFEILNGGPINRAEAIAAAVLKSELLERLGEYRQARTQAEDLVNSRRISAGERSACLLTLARIDIEHGSFQSAITHLQRSISVALAAGEHERACWAQIRLLGLVSDRSGPDAAVPLLAELRRNIARAADARLVAALHLQVAQVDGKRSLLPSAHRHVRLALEMLNDSPNVWLEAMAENIEVAIAIMRSDFIGGLRHAHRAVELAGQSGAANLYATSIGNVGNLMFFTGEYEHCIEYLERALQLFQPRSDQHLGALDGIARTRLVQNRLDDCDNLFDRIDHSEYSCEHQNRYAYRHSLLNRANALARRGSLDAALGQIQLAIKAAEASSDVLLFHLAVLTKTELLLIASRTIEASEALESVTPSVPQQPPDVYALYERVLARAVSTDNTEEAAKCHHARARRNYEALNCAPRLIDLAWSWHSGTAVRHERSELRKVNDQGSDVDAKLACANVLQSIAALIIHAGRLELTAREVVEVLWATGCVRSAQAVFRHLDGREDLLGLAGEVREVSLDAPEQRLSLGPYRDGIVELILVLKSDFESIASFNSVRFLLDSLKELERARLERDERATLWPVEDLPTGGDNSVISGHMRELMTFARRIATTNVNVLITGDSGTGKEILARAIHNFSDRARKPFVPFNCTAVPRDLLESQLFGHRRGAFTGADRDYTGLIRSARDGTLFLDEIGELGLDLQPKLLRFLESGEISPLGEPAALTVDVRIVAATNTNLEDAVRAGRFREDLFYRLNVVRLSIRPLRERRDEIPGFVTHFAQRAAEEFKKGDLRVAEETMERLLLYRWPGNVRQLQNEIRRMAALAEPNSTLMPDAISEDILRALPLLRHPTPNTREIAVPLHDKLMPTIARIECEMIKTALREHHGKVEAVAKALGISRKGLYLKRRRLGL